jgi:methyl-accepting chemotaxis protein
MNLKIRSRLILGFLMILMLGAVVTLAVFILLSTTINNLDKVISSSDVIEKKGIKLRLDLSTKSDSLRGYMLDPSDGSEKERKELAMKNFESDIAEIMKMSSNGEIFNLAKYIGDFENDNLIPIENEIIETIQSGNTENAKAIYYERYRPLRKQQESSIREIENLTSKKRDESLNAAAETRNYSVKLIWALVLFLIAIGIILSVYLSDSFATPIVRVSDSIKRASIGDLSDILKFDSRSDEIGELSRSTNSLYSYLKDMVEVADSIGKGDLTVRVVSRSDSDNFGNSSKKMVQSLCTIVSRVHTGSEHVKRIATTLTDSGQQLDHDSETVAASVQDIATIIEELSTNIGAIAHNVESQSTGVNQTSTAIHQLAGQLQRIAKNTKDLTRMVDTAHNVVEDGRRSVEQASEGMLNINSSINATAETVRNLGERAYAIRRIVEVINTISDQTNLLALNAAIEAARAGSHGLGFGVVAEEVRKLSDRTAQSAQEISQLINEMQKGAEQAAKQMNHSTELVSEGLTKSSNVVSAFTHIESMVSDVARTSNDIEGVITEQSAGIEQVLEATRDLTIITNEIQAASHEQATSTGEIVKAVERVNKIAERNNILSEQLSMTSRSLLSQLEQLEESVSVFKLTSNEMDKIISNSVFPTKKVQASSILN